MIISVKGYCDIQYLNHNREGGQVEIYAKEKVEIQLDLEMEKHD